MAATLISDGDIGNNTRVYDVTMLAGAVSEVITHGLVYTPTIVTITPNGADFAGCYTQTIALGAIAPFVPATSTGGTVTITKTAGAAASARVVITRAYTDQT